MAFAVNPLAIIIAAIIHQALGFLWYGALFAKVWQAAMGKSMAELGSPIASNIISSISALVMALVVGIVIGTVGAGTPQDGALWGALLGIGFVATTSATNGAYEARPMIVSLLFIAYEVLALTLMGMVLAVIS